MIPRLHPDDIEAIARRVVEQLQAEVATAGSGAAELLSPADVAKHIGRSAEWVREHADQLGVIRLGGGSRPRLWFRPDVVDERMRELAQCSRFTGPGATEPASLEQARLAGRVPEGLDGLPLRQVHPAVTSTKAAGRRVNAPGPATGIEAPTRQQRSPAPGTLRARSAAPSPEEDRR